MLALVARGHTNREIAQRLVMSPKTVSNHVEHVYEKTGVRSRAAAALFAVERGMFENQGFLPMGSPRARE